MMGEGKTAECQTLRRSSLILMRLRMKDKLLTTRNLKPPPPRPKRISSARPDTVNREDGNAATFDSNYEFSGNQNIQNGISTLDRVSCTTEQTVTSQSNMGSSSSLHARQKSPSSPTQSGTRHDFMTLSHAPVHEAGQNYNQYENELNSQHTQIAPIPSATIGSHNEMDMVHRAPITSLQFKHSTFKGASMSAVTMSQTSPEKSSNSLRTRKGKYEFSSGAYDDFNYLKSSTINSSSIKSHESDSPDFFSSTNDISVNLEPSERKTAITYGTLRKSNTSGSHGSVTELFKSKVRNSFRNSKFFSRNLTTEENIAPTVQPPSVELYDASLPYPEDIETPGDNWMSLSHDSGALFHHKTKSQPARTILPVQIPSLGRQNSEPYDPRPNASKTEFKNGPQVPDTSFLIDMTNQGGDKINSQSPPSGQNVTSSNPTLTTVNPPYILDSKSVSSFQTSTSSSSLDNSKTPEEESIEILEGVIKSHISENRYTTKSTIKSTTSFRSEAHITLGGDEALHGTVEPEEHVNETKNALLTSPHSLKPPIPPSRSSPRQQKPHKPVTTSYESITNLPITSPTSPKVNNVILQDQINISDPSLSAYGGLYTPSGAASLPSGKVTPTLTLDPTSHGSMGNGHAPPTVLPGLSITDVLSQEYTLELPSDSHRISPTLLNHLPLRLNSSFNSQISTTFDTNSFEDGSSTSFSESQDYLDSEDAQEILSNDGSIRKTGWLTTKHLLNQKRGKLEKPKKRKWRKFWVNLKGDQLLFYVITDGSTPEDTDLPVLQLPVEGCLIQPVPEHVTRDNVMCLSTANGSAYLMQANSQTEVDGWIQTIHIEAATLFAKIRQNGEEVTRKNIKNCLQQEIEKLKQEIEEDEKMKKMAELQMSLVTDVKSRKAISDQILKWEENSEKNNVHVFRLRCYLSALEGTEQPNPRSAISSVCKSSKQLLSSLKLFNITTLHSLVVSKQQSLSLASKKRFNLGLKRSGSFTGSLKDDSSIKSGTLSPSKPKKSSIFGSLRGFDTWRGSSSSVGTGKKKKHHHRPSVTGIISAFTSSSNSSSAKDIESTSGKKRQQISGPMIFNSDITIRSTDEQLSTPGTLSDDDIIDGFNSVGGSLDSLLLAPPDAWCVPIEWDSSSIRVSITTNEFVTVTMTKNMTFRQLLEIVCRRKQLDSSYYYLVGENANGLLMTPASSDLLSEVKCERLKVKKKRTYSVEVQSRLDGFGFSILPKTLCCPLIIDEVSPDGAGDFIGLQKGEEIMIVNGELTSDMNEDEAQKALEQSHLRLLVRTCNYEASTKSKMWWPISQQEDDGSNSSGSDTTFSNEDKERSRSGHLMAVLEDYLNKIVVPPPPVTSNLQPSFIRSPFSSTSRLDLTKKLGSVEDIMSMLVVPPPEHQLLPPPEFGTREKGDITNKQSENDAENGCNKSNNKPLTSKECDNLIENLLQKAEAVTAMCRRLMSHDQLLSQSEFSEFQQHHLNDIQKIWKVLQELVDTERNYVEDLDCLLKRFLEPLHSEGILDVQDIESLLRSVERILNFQKTFLEDLTDALAYDVLDSFSLNRSLLSVTSTFIQHAAQFKLYAVFSTCHTVAQDIIEQAKSDSSEIRIFLEARNPKHQHSLSLDSYLIKPIQRVLKYPLLIRELLSLSESIDIVSTKAKNRLRSALHAMHAVARHINDTQTVHDEFGSRGFTEIMQQASGNARSEVTTMLNLNELLCYCTTEWTNAFDDVATKLKKGNVIETLVFVFQKAVVLLCRSVKQRDTKKKVITPQHDGAPNLRSSVSNEFIFSDFIHGTELVVDENLAGNALEITNNTTSQSYHLNCDSAETEQRIVKTIRYVIKDCMRSMREDSVQSSETPLDDGIPSVENYMIRNDGSSDKDLTLTVNSQVEQADDEQYDSDTENNPLDKTLEPTERKKQREFFYRPNVDECRESTASLKSAVKGLNTTMPPPRGSINDITNSPSPQDGVESNTNSPVPTSVEKSEHVRVPITLPLPTYEVAVASIMSSTESLKTSNPKSGLWISSAPASTRSSNTGSDRSLDSSTSKTNTIVSSRHDQSDKDEKSPIHGNHNGDNEENINNNSSNIDNIDSKRNNTGNKMSKNGSPARYNMVYGVAPFESKL